MAQTIYVPQTPRAHPDPGEQAAAHSEEVDFPPPARVRRIVPDGDDRIAIEQAIQERLVPSAAECAYQKDPLTAAALADEVARLIADEPPLQVAKADDKHGGGHDLGHIFRTLPLAPPLIFELTHARDERPDLFDHSLRVAYCAAALAAHSGMAHHEIANAAVAGLFHDIGLLHIDPALLHRHPLLEERERRYIYSHPLTGYLILEQSRIWHPVVSTAILEHHERLDGSGYPRGLAADRLGTLGQLLAVAELATAMMPRGAGYASHDRLCIVLRMNEGRLNHDFCEHMRAMFPPVSMWSAGSRSAAAAIDALVGLSVAFLGWQAIAGGQPQAPLVAFIGRRLGQLDHSLAEVGIDLEYWSEFCGDAELDAASLGEIATAAREGTWQLRAIADEARRRWEHLAAGSEAIAADVAHWLDGVGGPR